METRPFRVVLFSREYRRLRQAFRSGSVDLDRYLQQQARQDAERGAAAVWILLDNERDAIAGYYTLSMAEVALQDLPEEVVRRLPRYPALPAVLIGRLAVSVEYQGRGLGRALLVDALRRARDLRGTIGFVAVIVDAKDASAEAFYERLGFRRLEDWPRRLFLPIADIP